MLRRVSNARTPATHGLTLALQLAPASGPIVGDDVREHRGEGGRVYGLALADRDGAGDLVVLSRSDDSLGIREMPPS